jgi:hypothetical protein
MPFSGTGTGRRRHDAEGSGSLVMLGGPRLMLPAWMRWRFGERVCVICGESPTDSVSFPPEMWAVLGLAHSGPSWLVPTCTMHRRAATWPVRTALALADEHRAVMEGLPERVHQSGFWDDPRAIGEPDPVRPGGPPI